MRPPNIAAGPQIFGLNQGRGVYRDARGMLNYKHTGRPASYQRPGGFLPQMPMPQMPMGGPPVSPWPQPPAMFLDQFANMAPPSMRMPRDTGFGGEAGLEGQNLVELLRRMQLRALGLE